MPSNRTKRFVFLSVSKIINKPIKCTIITVNVKHALLCGIMFSCPGTYALAIREVKTHVGRARKFCRYPVREKKNQKKNIISS